MQIGAGDTYRMKTAANPQAPVSADIASLQHAYMHRPVRQTPGLPDH
jgi:hypothetical protein